MAEIPQSFYVIAGTLIVANIGTVISIVVGVGKLIWFISKLDSRVHNVEVNHSKDISAAHKAIRDLRKEYNQLNGELK